MRKCEKRRKMQKDEEKIKVKNQNECDGKKGITSRNTEANGAKYQNNDVEENEWKSKAKCEKKPYEYLNY